MGLWVGLQDTTRRSRQDREGLFGWRVAEEVGVAKKGAAFCAYDDAYVVEAEVKGESELERELEGAFGSRVLDVFVEDFFIFDQGVYIEDSVL